MRLFDLMKRRPPCDKHRWAFFCSWYSEEKQEFTEVFACEICGARCGMREEKN